MANPRIILNIAGKVAGKEFFEKAGKNVRLIIRTT